MPAMAKGPVELPGLKEAGLTAYVKLTNPRLATVSDSVDLGGGRTDHSSIDTSVNRSVSGSVNATLLGGGGGVRDNPATPEHHRDVNASSGGFDAKRSGLDASRTFSSSGDIHPAAPGSTSTSGKRSKVMVYDTEIRFQKDGRGTALVFKDGARIRMADEGGLPDTVTQAQDRVKTAEEAWKDAEKDLLTARHGIDDAYLAARDELATRHAELAQVSQNAAVHVNNTTALREQLWDAHITGDEAEIHRLEQALDQAHLHGTELTQERQEIERRIDELQQPQRDAQQLAEQAHQRARTAEDAWWDARRDRDNAIADVNRPPADEDEARPAPAHSNNNEPNRGENYNPGAHASTKHVIDDESWRHSQERTAPWFEPDRPLRPEQWENLRRDDLARTVHTEIADVKTSSKIGANGRPQFERYTGHVRYDLRRIEVEPGRFVQEHTVKLHLSGDPEQVAKAKADAKQAVDSMLNKGYRLPSGDQFHLRLEFPETAKDAHSTVHVGDRATDQTHWKAGENPNVLAHEVLHYVGPGDEYRDPSRVFLDNDRKSAVS